VSIKDCPEGGKRVYEMYVTVGRWNPSRKRERKRESYDQIVSMGALDISLLQHQVALCILLKLKTHGKRLCLIIPC
jgi:hypothetical protein